MRIAEASNYLAKYDPDEARDWHGRWSLTDEEGSVNKPLRNSNNDPGAAREATPPNNSTELLDIAYNGLFHDQLVKELANYLETRGATVLTNVRLIAMNGTTAIADIVLRSPGKPVVLLEVKTGFNPTFTPNQMVVYPMAQVGGHVTSPDPRISRLGLMANSPLPPFNVYFVYQQGPGTPLTVEPAPDPYLP